MPIHDVVYHDAGVLSGNTYNLSRVRGRACDVLALSVLCAVKIVEELARDRSTPPCEEPNQR